MKKLKSLLAVLLCILLLAGCATPGDTGETMTTTQESAPSSTEATEPSSEAEFPSAEPTTQPSEPTTEPPTTEPPTTEGSKPTACDHDYTLTQTQDATCTEPGFEVYVCGKCGGSYQSATTATGHSYNAATCLEPKTCKACGAQAGKALGHSFSKGTCSRCQAADPDYNTPQALGTLKVHYLDVGQADAMVLECNGKFALIDGGYPEDSLVICEYLAQLGVKTLDLVVATHPHGDHIGGIPNVLSYFIAKKVWSGAITYHNSYVGSLRQAVAAQRLTLEFPVPGDTFNLGGAILTVIGPVRTDYEDTNNVSLVIMAQHGDNRFLFTGDMEQVAETELLESGADVKADVLKVGHHGSYSSTGYYFLREVAPQYAVISCGAANEYGHPHDEPLSRLEDAGVTIFRTDKMYTIVAESDGKDITFTWENGFAQPWTPDSD